MTAEQEIELLAKLERIAVALELRQPTRNQSMNPRSPAIREELRKLVEDELKKQK